MQTQRDTANSQAVSGKAPLRRFQTWKAKSFGTVLLRNSGLAGGRLLERGKSKFLIGFENFRGMPQVKSGSLQLKPRPGACADFRVFCERIMVFCHFFTFSAVSSKVSVGSAPFLLIHAMYNSLSL